MNYQTIIEEIYTQVQNGENLGDVASYIPELSTVSPEKFGIHLGTIKNGHYQVGDCNQKFSIQSIVKVLALTLAYKNEGIKIWKRVGVEPSGSPFNSLVQLEYDLGIPRNPFINAGAIVICDILVSQLDNPKKILIDFIQNLSNNPNIHYSQKVVDSEKSMGFRNAALINFIKSFGNIHNDVDVVLDFYYHLCSIEMTCKELAQTFLFLANNGKIPFSREEILTVSQTKRINAIMQTCGFYDEAGEFTFRVGLPGKSGVGGGIIAIHPSKYAIAVWSPRLNKKGNSYRGMKFLELFTSKTELSIF
ncbi:MAG: glutaminase [Chitinophagales bacterium]